MQQKFWAWGDQLHVYDEQHQPVFWAKGRVFSWGHQLSFQDMQGNELAFIKQKLMTWMSQYEIHRDGQRFAQVRKNFTWFTKKFTLEMVEGDSLVIQGDFWDHRYQFRCDDRVVAKVDKAYWAWTDTYGIETEEGEDDVAILCSTIVIDKILDDQQRRRSNSSSPLSPP
ncbi:hypothetical protein DSM3645_17270 [Blastopirellula marina DSM 3645]|uniref:YxjI n=2 Tax=Blastopirellula marina TaxID=124 RepID=A3ZNM9_9BACT|nr:hypothetical protein DSM3645_17270 [Blastopirellula marina DSM 3645]